MCVLTFIPTSKKGFILTSNRDETVERTPALPPQKYLIASSQVFFPKDPQGSGTWIASSGDFTLCLLNGGLKKHNAAPPYRHSRGRVILDFFSYQHIDAFYEKYLFDGIEPFTLVMIERKKHLVLGEIRWTGTEKILTYHSAECPKIWSSVTLYSPEIIAKREQWFEDFLRKTPEVTYDNLLKFHHFGGDGDIRNSVKMNRDDKLKTLSITQFEVNEEQFLIKYEDLLINKIYNYRVFVESELPESAT